MINDRHLNLDVEILETWDKEQELFMALIIRLDFYKAFKFAYLAGAKNVVINDMQKLINEVKKDGC